MATEDRPALFTAILKEDRYYLKISSSLLEHDTMQLEWMLQKALTSGCRYILIDGAQMSHICVTALQVFISNLGPLQAKGMKMGIFGISQGLLDLLNSSEINNLLTIGETETDVMNLLRNQSP